MGGTILGHIAALRVHGRWLTVPWRPDPMVLQPGLISILFFDSQQVAEACSLAVVGAMGHDALPCNDGEATTLDAVPRGRRLRSRWTWTSPKAFSMALAPWLPIRHLVHVERRRRHLLLLEAGREVAHAPMPLSSEDVVLVLSHYHPGVVLLEGLLRWTSRGLP